MLFFMLLNDDIADNEKPHAKRSPNFVVNGFSRLFLYPSIFSTKHSTST